MLSSKRALIALAAIVALAACLRFHHIGAESLWLDEAISVQFAHESLAEIVHDTGEDVHPPLYYFALHYWILAAGDSEAAARSLSAIFGLLTVIALYRLGAQAFDPITGLAGAFLLAISSFHISYSQEARMYALLTLLSLCSMDGFLRLLKGPSRAAFAEYIMATALMLYTQIYGGFVLGGQVLVLVALMIGARPRYLVAWRRVLLAQSIAFILYLPWLEHLFQQVLFVQQGFWIPPGTPITLLKTLKLYAGSTELAWLLTPLALCPLAFARTRRHALFLVAWVASLLVLPFLVSKVASPIFAPKYTIAGSIAFLLLAARGLTLLPGRVLKGTALAAVIYLSVEPLEAYYQTTHKDRWREMVSLVESQARPADLVLFNQPFGKIAFDYYARRQDIIEVPFLEYRDGLTSRSIRELVNVEAAGHARVWLVLSNSDPVTSIMLETLGQNYDAATHIVDRGIEIYLFVRK